MVTYRNRAHRALRSCARRGTAAVEFAVTVPIMLLILFGSVELSRMNMIRETANNAAYEAVRNCIVPGATNAEGVAAAREMLQSVGVSNATITVSPATITDTTPTVTATITVPYSSNMWVTPVFSTSRSTTTTCTLTRDWVVSTRRAQ